MSLCFPLMSLSSPRIPSGTPQYFLLSCLLGAPGLVVPPTFLALVDCDSLRNWSGVLYNAPQSGFVWCFTHGESGIMGLQEEDHRGEMPSSSHHMKDTHCQYNLLLVMLTLTTWPMSSLPGFFTVKFSSLPVPYCLEASH